MIFDYSDSSRQKIVKLVDYMKKVGLVFKTVNMEDSSPYAILINNTSVGYRTRTKWNRTGIVFFCARDRVDMLTLSSALKIDVLDNSTDFIRPYALFVTDNQLEQAIQILLTNQKGE